MKSYLSPALSLILVLATLAALVASPAASQAVAVTSGDEKVVVDGNTVRIEDSSGVTVVDSNWRRTTVTHSAADTEQILVDLGAVTVDDRIQLNLAGDILFDFGSAAIRPDAAAQLSKVAHVIRGRSVGDVYVIGHTDSIGDDTANETLSLQRATAVMQWLNRQEGIPAAVMVGSGMGKKRPVAHNTNPDGSDSPEGRAKNRRVEIQMATREGVVVGPQVAIGPGAVTVTDDAVTVGSAVKVDDGGVTVGGIRVTDQGVSIGGKQVVEMNPGAVVVSTNGAKVVAAGRERAMAVSSGQEAVCRGGEECDFGCPYGDCDMTCAGGASCDFTCSGGDCMMTCAGGADCEFNCSGGDCQMVCAAAGACDFSCSGGDCLFQCPRGASCDDLSCSGGDCACEGPAC